MTGEELAFANRNAPLVKRGKRDVRALARRLPTNYDIVPSRTRAAVSEFTRAQQTANLLRFQVERPNPLLNEVDHGMQVDSLRAALERGELPEAALRAAEAVLCKPPEPDVWVTHGLLIAGLCAVLEIADEFDDMIPHTCEVRRLPLK